jgi:cytochrome P450
MTSQWVVHRLSQLFANPNDFRPERWLTEETAALPRCAYFPFGAGPRTCIGLGFAMMESALLLAAIAQRFRMVRTDDRELQPWATMTLRPPIGIRLTLQSI